MCERLAATRGVQVAVGLQRYQGSSESLMYEACSGILMKWDSGLSHQGPRSSCIWIDSLVRTVCLQIETTGWKGNKCHYCN